MKAEIKRKRQAAGLCVGCGKGPPEQDKTLCRSCLDRLSAEQRVLRARRKERGTCQRCAKRKPERGTMCEECREYRRSLDRQLYQKRVRSGVCSCGKLTEAYRRRCPVCLNEAKEARERFKRDGLCLRCGGVRKPGRKFCKGCIANKGAKRIRDRLAAINAYGAKCVCCGEATIEFLEIDHVDGGGAKHRKEIGQSSIYPWLRRHGYPEGFQILCSNCNRAKWRYGECPHQTRKRKKP